MNKLYCLSCPNGCLLTIAGSGEAMIVEGAKCEKGEEFARAELADPVRTVTTTVRTVFPEVPVISVRTAGEVPKEDVFDVLEEISKCTVETEMACGDVLIEDVADTGVSVIITSPALMSLEKEIEERNAQLNAGGAGAGPDEGSGEQAYTPEGGIGVVVDNSAEPVEGVLDDIGEDHLGGIVGAAGEAVGVDDPEEEEDDADASGKDGGIKKQSRSHIKIK